MRFYHIPRFFQKLYARDGIWEIPTHHKILYLTFDDGPTTEVTQWILDVLDKYNAKATFFCVGDNVRKHPEIFSQITEKGHAVGNHSFNHLKGWETATDIYVENVMEAEELIPGHLFRPPYGKIKSAQARLIRDIGYKIILWTVLTYDFDINLDKDEAWARILKYSQKGSILVFHDHVKAFENLKELLPKTLEYFSRKGFRFEKINL